MASPAQINANRLNALKSTGPRTEAGKGVSRLSALRHGADAELSVIPGENEADLNVLARDYHANYRPRTPEEQFLVDTLVQSDWLRRRYLRIESEMTRHLLAEMEPCDNALGALYCSGTPGARALERIRRHHEAATRAWFRAARELDRLRRQATDDLLFGVPAPQPVESKDEAPEIGFVPPIPEPLRPMCTAGDRFSSPASAPEAPTCALRLTPAPLSPTL